MPGIFSSCGPLVQPSHEPKYSAFTRLLEDRELSQSMSRQIFTGFGPLDQTDVLEPFRERYFEALPTVWATRSLDWALEFSTGMFPHASAGQALLDQVDELLTDDELQRPLRRVLLEQRDTLVRTLQARALDAAAS